MIEVKVIIVGGGPAGSTCAWKLKQGGVDAIIIEKQKFPRHKLCAGWIHPGVLHQLEIAPRFYPYSLTRFDKLHFYVRGHHLPVPTRQFAVRRYEFDFWLLKRSGVPVYTHKVENIVHRDDSFIIDDTFRCHYLVGAGGTSCPVYRTFFHKMNPKTKEAQITTLEQEFRYNWHDPNCYLWFFDDGLSGYSWYVPKKGGYVNVGIGGKVGALQARGETIQQHWDLLVKKLGKLGLISDVQFKPKGCTYYLRNKNGSHQSNNAFVIGDAAGLATLDMGEGIGPAVQSGRGVARAIIKGSATSIRSVSRLSLPGILFPWLK